jgi:predicted Zn-dependent protease
MTRYHCAVKIRTLLAILFLLAPGARADGLPDLGESSRAELSPQMERRIGESIMRDIRLREPAYLDDAEVTGYINRLGLRLAAASPEARQDFEFFLLRDSTLNAFAMPGGFIGVHTGLILAAQSESELAGVLAHEISHVTQRHLARMLSKQNEVQWAQWLAIAVAVLAARSNSQVSQAAIMSGSAAGIQSQLNYSRDFEREADRIGILVVERAGFDVRGMASFFERLQKFGRLYENNAPAYLQTHPLTVERISDMENRVLLAQYRQVADSLDFLLVRAKLKAQQNTPREAVADFEAQLREKKYASAAAAHYGMGVARLRAKDPSGAEREVAELRRLKVASPMVDGLAADVRREQNDFAGAARILREARARPPQARALAYGLLETLLADHQPQEALRIATDELQLYPSDARLHGFQARSYAALGKRLQQHRAQAELYAQLGQLSAAVEQMQMAQKAGDGDFYEQSQVDARLRELRARLVEEMKQKQPF